MRNLLIFSSLLFAAQVVFSCSLKAPADFEPPSVEFAAAQLEGRNSVSLHCELSSSRFEVCGFMYGNGRPDKRVECIPSGKSFEVMLSGLEQGVVYSWFSFYSAGGVELKSDTGYFRLTSDADPVTIPDEGFRNYLLGIWDEDGNGEISYAEALAVTSIHISSAAKLGVQSLRGIEYMPELEELSCLGEMSLTGSPTGTLRFADVTHNPKLKVLVLSNNSALRGKLDLSRNPQLDKLDLGNTGLDYPDISRNTALTYVRFTGLKGRLPDFSGLHRLKSLFMEWPEDEAGEPLRLDISSMSELETLSIGGGKYELSDLAKNPHLKTLSCPSCGLKTLDISGLPELESLECWGNMIQSLDVSNNTVLSYLDCSPMDDEDGNNLLAELLLSNRHEIPNVSIDRSPDYIPEGTRIVRLEQYPPNDELWYTTLYGDIIQPYKAKVCPEVNLLSNTNRGGRGVMKFDGTVVSFSEWALYKTPNLRELVIPSGVVSTSYSCFRECQQLRRVVFAPGLRILGDSSLHHNEALEEVILPDTVVSIEKDALSHAYSLRHINLPPNLEKLGRSAFLYCRKLESIVLPATLKSIGIYAFEHDKALTSITCLAPAPPAGGTEMFDDTSECPIYVPAASVEAYRTAPYWNKYAHRIREIEE